MYKDELSNSYDNSDIFTSVEGYDLFNSAKIFELDKDKYASIRLITRYAKRMDLISSALYGGSANYGLFGITNRIFDPEDLKIGLLIKQFTEDNLALVNGVIHK